MRREIRNCALSNSANDAEHALYPRTANLVLGRAAASLLQPGWPMPVNGFAATVGLRAIAAVIKQRLDGGLEPAIGQALSHNEFSKRKLFGDRGTNGC